MQDSQPPDEQAAQISGLVPTGADDRDGQRSDRGPLVDYGEDPAVPGQLVERFAQLCLGVRQRRVVQPFACPVQRDRVMVLLSYV